MQYPKSAFDKMVPGKAALACVCIIALSALTASALFDHSNVVKLDNSNFKEKVRIWVAVMPTRLFTVLDQAPSSSFCWGSQGPVVRPRCVKYSQAHL